MGLLLTDTVEKVENAALAKFAQKRIDLRFQTPMPFHKHGYKVGIAPNRDEAMRRAERFIDELVKARSKPK